MRIQGQSSVLSKQRHTCVVRLCCPCPATAVQGCRCLAAAVPGWFLPAPCILTVWVNVATSVLLGLSLECFLLCLEGLWFSCLPVLQNQMEFARAMVPMLCFFQFQMLHQDGASKKEKIKTKRVDFEDGLRDEVEDAVQKVVNATGCSVSIFPCSHGSQLDAQIASFPVAMAQSQMLSAMPHSRFCLPELSCQRLKRIRAVNSFPLFAGFHPLMFTILRSEFNLSERDLPQ